MTTWDHDATLLCSAITNNFGVWLHDNGDTGNAYFCFGALASMLAVWEPPLEALLGFNSNLKLFNIPLLEVGQQAKETDAAAKMDVSEDECISSSSSEMMKDESMGRSV